MPVLVHIGQVFITAPDPRVIVQPEMAVLSMLKSVLSGQCLVIPVKMPEAATPARGKAQPIAAAKDMLDAITEDWNEWRERKSV